MTRTCLLSAIIVSLASLAIPDGAEAQTQLSSTSLQAVQAAAGTARMVGTPRVSGDSILISLEDAGLTSDALVYGGWRPGGREGSPRAVGRAIAEVARSGLSEPSRANVVVVDVAGAAIADSEPGPGLPSGAARVSFPYHFTDSSIP